MATYQQLIRQQKSPATLLIKRLSFCGPYQFDARLANEIPMK